MYQFTLCPAPDWDLERRREPVSGLLHVYEGVVDYAHDVSGNQQAHFRGALQALFGDPSTTGSDALFEYSIEARDDQQTWLLIAFLGSSGPMIAGRPHDPDIAAVTEALRSLILTTPPADIDCYYYDGEYDATCHFVCQDGVCTCTSLTGDARHTDAPVLRDDHRAHGAIYQFTAGPAPDLGTEGRHAPLAKLLSVYEPYVEGNDLGMFRGVLQALFGDPSTTGSDPLFAYSIEARNEQRSWVLTAYLAAGGPAIGGRPQDPDIAVVAEALRSLILTTPPADIDCYHYDSVYDQTFHFVCQDGVCSCTYTDARYGP